MSNSTETLARQRICSLLDEKSFMEIGSMVTARSTDFCLTHTDTPSDGVITGYGLINGNLVYVYSQDVSVLNGTIGEMHGRKIAALYDMAIKMGAPIIGLIDCAGIRIQESVDALHAFGEIYGKQAMASGVIPQICAIFGTCGGGLSVVSALSDFTYVETKGKLFVNSPNTITGNSKEKCDTSSPKFQSQYSGCVDGVGTTEEILAEIRQLVSVLPGNSGQGGCEDECYDDLNRNSQEISGMKEDAALLLTEISDDHLFVETKKDYAKDMVTGFIKMNGMTIGAVGNRSKVYDADGNVSETFEEVLTVSACRKATDFVNFCDAFEIPVLSLTNVKGLETSKCAEKNLARALAGMTKAFASATVPKVNLITGTAYGSAYVMMNSKGLGADLVYAWEGSKISMMDSKMAAFVMCPDAPLEVVDKTAKEYEALQSDVTSAARRGYVDLIIQPEQTRKYAVAAFEMLYTKCVDGPMKKHGTK